MSARPTYYVMHERQSNTIHLIGPMYGLRPVDPAPLFGPFTSEEAAWHRAVAEAKRRGIPMRALDCDRRPAD